jgi:hypothetical protein
MHIDRKAGPVHADGLNLVLKDHAFRIVFLKPFFRGVCIRKDLEVIRVSDLLARIW